MADYAYDEGGSMALYFLLTFLAVVLIPMTLSISPSKFCVSSEDTDLTLVQKDAKCSQVVNVNHARSNARPLKNTKRDLYSPPRSQRSECLVFLTRRSLTVLQSHSSDIRMGVVRLPFFQSCWNQVG